MATCRIGELLQSLETADAASRLSPFGTSSSSIEATGWDHLDSLQRTPGLRRVALAHELHSALRDSLLGGRYGQYYFAADRGDGPYRPAAGHARNLRSVLEGCIRSGELGSDLRARLESGPEDPCVRAAQVSQLLWPSQKGQLYLAFAHQAAGRSADALRSFSMAASQADAGWMLIAARLAQANLLLHCGDDVRASRVCDLVFPLAKDKVSYQVTALLAASRSGSMKSVQKASFLLDENIDDVDEAVLVVVEAMSRRWHDKVGRGPFHPGRELREACRYAGPRTRALLNLSGGGL